MTEKVIVKVRSLSSELEYIYGHKVSHRGDRFGYKVVSGVSNGVYAPVTRMADQWTRYKLGKETYRRPKCGDLSVFSNFRDAMKFSLGLHSSFLAKRIKSSHDMLIVRVQYLPSKGTLSLYKNGMHGLAVRYPDLPHGTDFAESIKVLRELSQLECDDLFHGGVDVYCYEVIVENKRAEIWKN